MAAVGRRQGIGRKILRTTSDSFYEKQPQAAPLQGIPHPTLHLKGEMQENAIQRRGLARSI